MGKQKRLRRAAIQAGLAPTMREEWERRVQEERRARLAAMTPEQRAEHARQHSAALEAIGALALISGRPL